jgi:hypothetical protein
MGDDEIVALFQVFCRFVCIGCGYCWRDDGGRAVAGSGKAGLPPDPAVAPTATPTPPPDREFSSFAVEDNGAVVAGGLKFETMSAYFSSEYFQQAGKRCGTKVHTAGLAPQAVPGDCTLARTVIQSEYWPYEVYIIPIVFHVIFSGHGQGRISDQRIIDQVQVLNEDFQALSGSLGAEGYDTKIHFQLAGITRTKNDAWFNDTNELAYKQALGWDQDHYLNVYVNTASGYLGYSYLPLVGGTKFTRAWYGGRPRWGAGIRGMMFTTRAAPWCMRLGTIWGCSTLLMETAVMTAMRRAI